MKIKFFVAAALAMTASLATSAHADIKWETDFTAATAESQKTGKPIFIDFYTDWCHWCKKLDADVYPDPAVEAIASKYIMVKLDAEKGGKDAAKKFEVKGYPTLTYVAPDGTTLANNPGYVEVPELTKTMKEMLDKAAAAAKPAAATTAAAAPAAAPTTATK